jgi:hypothetical protein
MPPDAGCVFRILSGGGGTERMVKVLRTNVEMDVEVSGRQGDSVEGRGFMSGAVVFGMLLCECWAIEKGVNKELSKSNHPQTIRQSFFSLSHTFTSQNCTLWSFKHSILSLP